MLDRKNEIKQQPQVQHQNSDRVQGHTGMRPVFQAAGAIKPQRPMGEAFGAVTFRRGDRPLVMTRKGTLIF